MNGYAKRKLKGVDRYGTFREGKQMTPDRIIGNIIWIPFSHLRK